MNLLNEIIDEWQRYKKQIIGATIIANAGLLFLNKEWGLVVVFLIAALILDLFIIEYCKEESITKWIRRQFNGWLDKIVLISYGIILIKIFGISTELGQAVNAAYWLFITAGHLKWEK